MSFDGAEIGKGEPLASLGRGVAYFETDAEGKVIGLWLRESSGSSVFLADLTGTPANGSVTAEKVAPANIDGAAGVPSVRTLDTDSTLAANSDTRVASQKATRAYVSGFGSAYRLAHQTAGRVSSVGETGKKYFLQPGQTEVTSLSPTSLNAAFPMFLGWEAEAHKIGALTTKLRISALCSTTTAPACTFTLALYSLTVGATYALNEAVSGSELVFATPAKETVTRKAGADFTPPADGAYALGVTLDKTPSANAVFQVKVEVRNVV